MQGFNMGRYRPYDSDPRKESFNGRTGTRGLGKRERKVDTEGILVVRFELPFNVWCDECESHIGQGVRFNAEKKKVGDYFSTPIFSFKVKKTCCQTFMEIQTDPKNTQYIITKGARKQNSDWDPEQNGGFPIYDVESKSSGKDEENDAFENLEKKLTEKEKAKKRFERLKELQSVADAHSSDPYTLNASLRDSFRREKKQRLQIQANDDDLRKRIGWNPDRLLLNDKEDEEIHKQAQKTFNEAGKRQSALKSSSSSFNLKNKSKSNKSSQATTRLAARIIANTKRKEDPFAIKK